MGKNGWAIERISGPRQFVGVHVPDADVDQLDEIAAKAGRSRSAVVRDAIAHYLDDGPLEAA